MVLVAVTIGGKPWPAAAGAADTYGAGPEGHRRSGQGGGWRIMEGKNCTSSASRVHCEVVRAFHDEDRILPISVC